MFDIGFWELVILFGLGLIILGPERLPKVAMRLGNWAGQARRMARQLSDQIRYEINDVEGGPSSRQASPEKDSPATWQRPGMDDLKPKNADDTQPDQANSENEADQRPSAE